MAKTERKTERAIVETTILRDDSGMAIGVEFDVIGCDPLTIHTSELAGAIAAEALCHGLKQKLGDAAAISRGEDGKPATPADKYAAIFEVYERITATEPSWNKTERGTGTGARGLLAAALDQLFPKLTGDGVDKFLAGKTDKEQSAMRKDPRIATVIERIKLERAAKRSPGKSSVDVDAMLGELDAGDDDNDE